MCEYCKEGNGIGKPLLYDKNFSSLCIFIWYGLLWEKSYDCGIVINYCPICGRKLGGE